jgi:glutamyl-tRNA synthetase
MTAPVRVRFAPSPTGEPHVGNIRTALFAWLFARGQGGTFLIRIEDTDRARFVEGAVESILGSLRWLGLDWDEGPDVGGSYGPYYQSDRKERGDYKVAVNRMLASGHGYYCFCSSERLKGVREEQRAAKKPPGYDRYCRGMNQDQLTEAMSENAAPVVRFAMPESGQTVVTDLVRGEVAFENKLIDDFVMLKSDGFPTYHLANVVDDHAMKISHVLRAEEWLPSLPRHWQMYEALGFEKPLFAHVPIILAPDKSKLSKRHGATSISEFQKNGYLPQAMVNFLAMLGWSLDDKSEVFSMQELKEHFSIERVAKSPAIFNVEKLDWMNGLYLRTLPPETLTDAIFEYWATSSPHGFDREPDRATLLKLVPLINERMKSLDDAAALIRFVFTDDISYETESLIQKKMDAERTLNALEHALGTLQNADPFEADDLQASLRALAEKLELKPGQLFGTLRAATTGQRISPPLFESMEVLGKRRTVWSVEDAIARLKKAGAETQ